MPAHEARQDSATRGGVNQVQVSIPYGTLKRHETSRRMRYYGLGIALLWLVALPGCTSEQLGTFSEVMRAMNDNLDPVNSGISAATPLPFQPDASSCIQLTKIPPVGTVFQARLQNTCDQTLHVTYGYRTRLAGTALHIPWCTPGYAGLRSGTATIPPWGNEPVAPLTYGHLDQVFWCACSDAHSRAAFAEPAGLGIHDCRCRCASR